MQTQQGGDKWNTAKVKSMASMFEGAAAFNQDISQWDTVLVETMASMFKGAAAFNQHIKTRVINFGQGPMTRWSTAKVKTMASMFEGAAAFNKDISSWNTALVENMASMFKGAAIFDQNLPTSSTNLWNTAAVTDMSNMFNGASDFGKQNGNCANWDVNAVTTNVDMYTNSNPPANTKQPCKGAGTSSNPVWQACPSPGLSPTTPASP